MKTLLLVASLFCSLFCHAQSKRGDTVYSVMLRPVEVDAKMKWKNDTDRYHYNQLRHYVQIVLPYVNEATAMYGDMKAHIDQQHLSGKERRSYLRDQEKVVRARLEDKVLKLNTTQAVLLIKLINRQTGVNLYEMLSEVKGSFTAIRWQTWARVNGYNLNRVYHPEEEPLLERVMVSLDYPLPSWYEQAALSSN